MYLWYFEMFVEYAQNNGVAQICTTTAICLVYLLAFVFILECKYHYDNWHACLMFNVMYLFFQGYEYGALVNF